MRYVRLSEAHRSISVADLDLFNTTAEDVPRIYIAEDLSRFKINFDVVKLDGRGRKYKAESTKVFPILDPDNAWNVLEEAKEYQLEQSIAVTMEMAGLRKTIHATVADVWQAYRDAKNLKPSSLHVYETAWRLYVEPTFGAREVRLVTHDDALSWWQGLSAAPSGRRDAGSLLKYLSKFAFRRGLSPVDFGQAIAVPAPKTRRPTPPTLETLDAILDAIGDRFRAPVLLGTVGLRIGEVCALRLDRIDLERQRVVVDLNAVEVNGRLELGTPKTQRGQRVVTLPSYVAEALRAHLETYPPAGEFAFSIDTGRQLRPSVLRRKWRDARSVAGADVGLRFHDLRHVVATELAARGAPAVLIAAYLGHDPRETMATYSHVLASQAEEMAGELDDAWRARQTAFNEK
jgi:integrase